MHEQEHEDLGVLGEHEEMPSGAESPLLELFSEHDEDLAVPESPTGELDFDGQLLGEPFLPFWGG